MKQVRGSLRGGQNRGARIGLKKRCGRLPPFSLREPKIPVPITFSWRFGRMTLRLGGLGDPKARILVHIGIEGLFLFLTLLDGYDRVRREKANAYQ